jgi:hypothetical protein
MERTKIASERVRLEKDVKCIVCQRIPPKEVFRIAHLIFGSAKEKVSVWEIATSAIHIINELDVKDRMFFCGKSRRVLLASLFYLLGLEKGIHASQEYVAEKCGCNVPSLRKTIGDRYADSERDWHYEGGWLGKHPEFFPNIMKNREELMLPGRHCDVGF